VIHDYLPPELGDRVVRDAQTINLRAVVQLLVAETRG
jgi:hypothetical protein